MKLKVIQVLAITASPKVRHSITKALAFSRKMNLVRMVDSAEEALALISSGTMQPDVVVLDMCIPGLDGAATIHTLLIEFSSVEVIALISFLEGITYEEAVRAGAISTLPRNSLTEYMLMKAILLAHNGLRYRLPALIDPMAPLVVSRWLPTSGHDPEPSE